MDTRILQATDENVLNPFKLGYVRSIVMRFWKGRRTLNEIWKDEYNITQSNITTANAPNLEQVIVEESP